MPGIFESQTSGMAHQISLESSTAASAPPKCVPSQCRNRISRRRSCGVSPSSAPTRGSCRGAIPSPRFSKAGAMACATRVQNLQSASKNNHPRACRPFPSVYSSTREIMAYPATFFAPFPSNVITLPRSFATPLSVPAGIRITSSNMPLITVRNSSMLSRRSLV